MSYAQRVPHRMLCLIQNRFRVANAAVSGSSLVVAVEMGMYVASMSVHPRSVSGSDTLCWQVPSGGPEGGGHCSQVAISDYGISLKELLSRTFSGRYSQIQVRFPEARLGTMFWLDPRSRMVYFSSTLALESILKGSVFLCLRRRLLEAHAV
jgi:hypothetical protein